MPSYSLLSFICDWIQWFWQDRHTRLYTLDEILRQARQDNFDCPDNVTDTETNDNNENCRVCWTNQKCVEAMPCAHVGTCITCTKQLTRNLCVVCNVRVDKFRYFKEGMEFIHHHVD